MVNNLRRFLLKEFLRWTLRKVKTGLLAVNRQLKNVVCGTHFKRNELLLINIYYGIFVFVAQG